MTPHAPGATLGSGMTDQITDEDLVSRLQAGDEAAFADLLRIHGGRLLATARRLLRQDADAQDAVQEAFLSAFRAIGDFDGRSALGTWLHRIVVNASLQRIRKRDRHPEQTLENLTPSFDATGHHTRRPPIWTESPEALMQQADVRRLVRETIDELPESARTALLLRDVEGLSTAEVAAALGIEPGAARVRVHRARQALKTLLERKDLDGVLE